MAIPTGKLNRKIVIESPTRTRDAYGASVDTFAELDTVWANWSGATGREAYTAGQEFGAQSAAVVIRYRSDVNTLCRILYADTYWNIRHVSEMGRREALRIIVDASASEAVAPAGDGINTFAGDAINTFAGDAVGTF